MYDVIAARALHVLAVVVWIGGVSLVTTAALPALRCAEFGQDRLQAFRSLERRFAWQARIGVIVVGLTGLYMVWRLSLWDRFRTTAFWWMHAMVCVWLLFAVILFIGEQPVAQRRRAAACRSGTSDGTSSGGPDDPSDGAVDRSFAWMQAVHWVLLTLSIVTVLAAVAGSHGWTAF
jgi:uncharacterized membrane protein